MATTPTINTGSVVVDANVVIAICARERDKLSRAETALKDYAARGRVFYAPGLIVGEVLYVLCGKLQNGTLTEVQHERAVRSFQVQMNAILPPPSGDAALITKGEEIRKGYGCSRSADSVYLALAEELSQSGGTELVTFDEGLQRQAMKNALGITIRLLPS
jgi:predicted nucleic acid-binding protein